MPATIAGSHLGIDTHANRPAANAAGQPIGALYSCSTHGLIYKTDGSTWSTYATLGGTGLADQGVFTYLDATEGSAPSTPASGKVRVYAKTDGRVYSKDDTGAEFGPFDAGGGGGSDFIATVTADANFTAYWPLNEHGTTYADAIGTDDLTALASTPGFGQAQDADVDGGSLVIPSSTYRVGRAALTWGNPFSYGCLITLYLDTTSDFGLIGQWDGAGSMAFLTNREMRAYSGSGFASWSATTADLLGTHLLVVTHNGTAVKLWWDGVEKATSNQTIPGTNVGGSFRIGAYNGATNGQGVFSDAFFCNGHALTGAEQLALVALADL